MTAPYGTVLVVGASGETGQHVIRRLREYGVPVRAIVRSTEKATALQAAGIDVFIGDVMEDLPWDELLADTQAVISTLGTRADQDIVEIEFVEYIVLARLVESAKKQRLAQVVLMSSIGVEHPDSIPSLSHLLRVKRKAELYLIRSQQPYTIVRAGGLINGPAQYAVQIGHGDTLHGTISRADAAEVLIQALFQPEALNQVVEIVNDPAGSAPDQAGLFAP